MNKKTESIQFYNSLQKPVLILSSRAGRGNISIAEAIYEYFNYTADVYHKSIEDFMPADIVNEDLMRYKFISSCFPFALYAIYKIPLFYYRKLLREKVKVTHLSAYKVFIETHRIATVICVSHRQAFWTSVLKRNELLDIVIYGVLTEFGNNLGWKYIFWDQMNGYIAPMKSSELNMGIPDKIAFKQLPIPARKAYYAIPNISTKKRQCLLIGGFFGQGRIKSTLQLLLLNFKEIHVHIICGDNAKLERKIKKRYQHVNSINIYGLVESIEGILSCCECVITKPGMSTLLEAHASNRKIFLFKGMPVAESNNARYAINNFNAEWFSVSSFSRWLAEKNDNGK